MLAGRSPVAQIANAYFKACLRAEKRGTGDSQLLNFQFCAIDRDFAIHSPNKLLSKCYVTPENEQLGIPVAHFSVLSILNLRQALN